MKDESEQLKSRHQVQDDYDTLSFFFPSFCPVLVSYQYGLLFVNSYSHNLTLCLVVDKQSSWNENLKEEKDEMMEQWSSSFVDQCI